MTVVKTRKLENVDEHEDTHGRALRLTQTATRQGQEQGELAQTTSLREGMSSEG